MNSGQKIKVNFEFWIKFKVEIKNINPEEREDSVFVCLAPVNSGDDEVEGERETFMLLHCRYWLRV